MNKQSWVKFAGMAALALLLRPGVYAQNADGQHSDRPDNPPANGSISAEDPDKLGAYDEIIIKRKSEKDAKVTVEIRDDQVFVNGKPVSQYQNDTLSVRKKKVRVIQGPPGFGPGVTYRSPGGNRRDEGWNDHGNEGAEPVRPALLGVYSEKTDPEGEGAKIKQITPGSAAEKAGLQPGDVITGVDEIKITGPENLFETIHNKYKPEDKATLTYQRDGKEQKVTVVLGAGKPERSQPNAFNFPGMDQFDFRNLPFPPNRPGEPGEPFGNFREEGRPRLGIHASDTEDGKGVKVLEVDEGSPAGKAGLQEGDIITRFDGKEVNSAVSLAEMDRAAKDKTLVKIGLIRKGVARELELKVPRRLKTADL